MENLNIMEMILSNMPSENDIQKRIKCYMSMHKSNCSNYINSQYEKEITLINALYKSVVCDLSAEILRTLQAKEAQNYE